MDWILAPRKSVTRDSRLLRRAAPYLLALWFVEMNVSYLGAWMFALDARIYHRAAVAYVNGLDPWAAVHSDYYFAAAPPSLLPYIPLAGLPETLAISFWMIAGVIAAIYILRKLRLAWWWFLFPPLAEAVLVGNAQTIALALLLASRAPFTAVAAIFKLYALVPALSKLNHVLVTIAALALTWLLLPWDAYIEALPSITARLEAQAQGGYSAYGNPPYLAAVIVALVILRRHGWQWFAIPAVWPSTQLHYSLYALPALTPVLAVGFAVPIRSLPPLIIVAYAAVILARQYRPAVHAYFNRDRRPIEDREPKIPDGDV